MIDAKQEPATKPLDADTCEDPDCPAHWVEQAREPRVWGRELHHLRPNSQLWLGFLVGVCVCVCETG